MCGKFTAMASWARVVSYSEAFSDTTTEGEASADREETFRVVGNLPVIVWDQQSKHRYVLPMRWGFPHSSDWRRPQPIHARSETIETTTAFSEAFLDGQRGIVLFKTFNEAPDVEGPTVQHTITPGDGKPLAAAVVWRRFDIPNIPTPMLACVLVTVPANALVATLPTDRMPAFIAPHHWETWLGQREASVDEVKACIKTVEGVRWTMTKEERAASKAKRAKPTVSDPGGLF